jgi:hypothetical protein
MSKISLSVLVVAPHRVMFRRVTPEVRVKLYSASPERPQMLMAWFSTTVSLKVTSYPPHPTRFVYVVRSVRQGQFLSPASPHAHVQAMVKVMFAAKVGV